MSSDDRDILTGRKVFLILVAFFGVMLAANITMTYYAAATFPGLASDSAYAEGVAYDQEIAAARAQEALGWKVDATNTRIAPGRSAFSVTQSDAAGNPTEGLVVTAIFQHPSDRARDRRFVLAEVAPGIYRGEFDIGSGGWDVFIEMTQGGERKFRSHSRIEIDDRNIGG
jgi:nitrogen fixation protein FixH